MIEDKNYYTNTFNVSDEQLKKLVTLGLERGGSFCDLYFENTTMNSLLLKDGEVASGGFFEDYGVGIRVLDNEKTGYAYCENTDFKSMANAAEAASTIAKGNERVRTFEASKAKYAGKPNPAADRYPMLENWRHSEASEFIPVLEKLRDLISSKDSRIVKIIASLSTQVSDILIFNSLGELKYDTRPLATLAVSAIFSHNGKIEKQSISRSFRMGVEMITDDLLEEIAEGVTKGIDFKFEAIKPKGGKMPVVMGAGASGILLHEAMGHAFEADFNRKGQSIFSDKMGQRICKKGISIVDDGTIRTNRGAVNFDDEGVPGQRTVMVEDGVLTSFLHDRISANYYGVSPTGNGRREGFRYSPLPRMRATYMESGDDNKENIIASVKKGIYVDEFANGQVQIGEGDFTFFVKSGFLIENGKLTQPIKDINIIGNGPQALSEISAVGNDLKIDDSAWTCGKGQSCNVSCGIPTVLIDNLTVGGE